jgi:hypothetical protein
MLIKDRDSRDEAIEQLRGLLSLNMSSQKKFLIERELRNIRPGDEGGKNAAHFINFYCADSPNWAIIHDLKIENNGSSAQIDHILINQFFDIFLIESKNYTYSLKITADGDFLVFDGCKYQTIDSPIEENRQRIQALKNALIEYKILPKRLGIAVRPRIVPFVLVSPAVNVLRPPKSVYDTSSIITADNFTQLLLKKVERIKRFYQKMKRLPKAFNTVALEKAAKKLASLNAPGMIDYERLFCPEETREMPAVSCCDEKPPVYGDFAI